MARQPDRRGAARPSAERDLLLLSGTEPNLAGAPSPTRSSTSPSALGVETVVTFGALLADVAHTRPVPITGLASDEELVDQLELQRPTTRDRPGSSGSSTRSAASAGMTSASLWAAVPHYVAAVPNPKAALALLRRLEGITGVAVDASELEEAPSSYEEQVSRAVAANPEIKELVERLEERAGRARTEDAERGRSRPATRSPATSSASSASAADDAN